MKYKNRKRKRGTEESWKEGQKGQTEGKEEGKKGGRERESGKEEGKEGTKSLKARKSTVLNSGDHLGNEREEQVYRILLDETFRNNRAFFFFFFSPLLHFIISVMPITISSWTN